MVPTSNNRVHELTPTPEKGLRGEGYLIDAADRLDGQTSYEDLSPEQKDFVRALTIGYVETYGHSRFVDKSGWEEGFTHAACNQDKRRPLTAIPIENLVVKPTQELTFENQHGPGEPLYLSRAITEGIVGPQERRFPCLCPRCNGIVNAEPFHTLNPERFFREYLHSLQSSTDFIVHDTSDGPVGFGSGRFTSIPPLSRTIAGTYFERPNQIEPLSANLSRCLPTDRTYYLGEIGYTLEYRRDTGAIALGFNTLYITAALLDKAEDYFTTHNISPENQFVTMFTTPSTTTFKALVATNPKIIYVNPRTFDGNSDRQQIVLATRLSEMRRIFKPDRLSMMQLAVETRRTGRKYQEIMEKTKSLVSKHNEL
jgi:hypothetical protein